MENHDECRSCSERLSRFPHGFFRHLCWFTRFTLGYIKVLFHHNVRREIHRRNSAGRSASCAKRRRLTKRRWWCHRCLAFWHSKNMVFSGISAGSTDPPFIFTTWNFASKNPVTKKEHHESSDHDIDRSFAIGGFLGPHWGCDDLIPKRDTGHLRMGQSSHFAGHSEDVEDRSWHFFQPQLISTLSVFSWTVRHCKVRWKEGAIAIWVSRFLQTQISRFGYSPKKMNKNQENINSSDKIGFSDFQPRYGQLIQLIHTQPGRRWQLLGFAHFPPWNCWNWQGNWQGFGGTGALGAQGFGGWSGWIGWIGWGWRFRESKHLWNRFYGFLPKLVLALESLEMVDFSGPSLMPMSNANRFI